MEAIVPSSLSNHLVPVDEICVRPAPRLDSPAEASHKRNSPRHSSPRIAPNGGAGLGIDMTSRATPLERRTYVKDRNGNHF